MSRVAGPRSRSDFRDPSEPPRASHLEGLCAGQGHLPGPCTPIGEVSKGLVKVQRTVYSL